MPTIPRAALDAFTQDLDTLGGDLARMLEADLQALDWDQPVAALREQVTEILGDYCRIASENAGVMSAGFYEQVRERSVGERLGAVPVSAYNEDATSASVRAFMQDIVDGKSPESVILKCAERLSRDIVRSAALTTMANTDRDPRRPRFARVPSGSETCTFCLMLASRGPVYLTAESAGQLDHYHANCKCRIVPVWGSKGVKTDAGGFVRRGGTQYEGYDPDECFKRVVDETLNPTKGTDASLGNGVKGAWREANEQGLTAFHDIHEVTEYIREAQSLDNLRERMQRLDREIQFYGLSEKQFERIKQLCRNVRAKFVS